GMRKERGLVVAVPISLSRPTQRNYSVLSLRFGRESSSGRGCLFALLKTDHDQMSNQAILEGVPIVVEGSQGRRIHLTLFSPSKVALLRCSPGRERWPGPRGSRGRRSVGNAFR